jgi:putative addiction module component (TIGR02574 family)
MSERARKILHDAMELPASERAAVAADLIASLDGEADENVDAAWAAEVERRARESGDDDVPWETVSAELRGETST